MDRTDSIVAAIIVGTATCVAMSQATDLMLDLKTGYLVGATPRMQQLGQFAGAWLGPIVVIGLVYVLHNAEGYGLGTERLPAAQAQALASTIDGIMGGDVPTQKYAAGAVFGGILSAMMGGLGNYRRSRVLPSIQYCPDILIGDVGEGIVRSFQGQNVERRSRYPYCGRTDCGRGAGRRWKRDVPGCDELAGEKDEESRYLLLAGGFLVGAYAASLDTEVVNWLLFGGGAVAAISRARNR